MRKDIPNVIIYKYFHRFFYFSSSGSQQLKSQISRTSQVGRRVIIKITRLLPLGEAVKSRNWIPGYDWRSNWRSNR